MLKIQQKIEINRPINAFFKSYLFSMKLTKIEANETCAISVKISDNRLSLALINLSLTVFIIFK